MFEFILWSQIAFLFLQMWAQFEMLLSKVIYIAFKVYFSILSVLVFPGNHC